MRTFRMVPAASVAALALVATACSSDGESHAETAPPPATTETAAQDAAAATTTTEAAPEPITEAETRWLEQVKRYSARVQRDMRRGGAITHSSMRRSARLYAGCKPMLRKAGDPGRFEPAQQAAQRACERLEKAARLLGTAIAATGPGGTIVGGTSAVDQFDRAFGGAIEASGNAQYDLQRAIGHAEEIKRTFGS